MHAERAGPGAGGGVWGAVSKGQPCLRAARAAAAASQSYPSALLWGLILERSAEPARREEAGRGLCRPALSLKAEHWRPRSPHPVPPGSRGRAAPGPGAVRKHLPPPVRLPIRPPAGPCGRCDCVDRQDGGFGG